MLEQSHECGRREIRLGRADHEIEEGARHRMRDRHARGIVNRKLVALEPRRHAPRKRPVGRDEGSGLTFRLDRRSQDERDRFGLVMRGRGHDELEA